jgi:hypothetical protein
MENTGGQNISYHEYFKKDLRIILILLSSISIFGNGLDLFVIMARSQYAVFINGANIIVTIVCLLLHFKFKFSIKHSLALCIYALALNFIVSQAIDFPKDNSVLFFLRATLFIALIITLSGICIDKIHSTINSFLFIVF